MHSDAIYSQKEVFLFMKSKLNVLERLDNINELPNKMLN